MSDIPGRRQGMEDIHCPLIDFYSETPNANMYWDKDTDTLVVDLYEDGYCITWDYNTKKFGLL